MQAAIVSGLRIGLLLLAVAGCDSEAPVEDFSESSLSVGVQDADQRDKNERNTLARTHDLTVDVDADVVDIGYQAIQSQCAEIKHCTVLNASITSSYRKRAALHLRLAPESVAVIDATAASFGEVTHRSTTAVDLAKPIFDAEERLGMLQQYKADLEELRKNARKDIDALVRVASEMATTQSNIESLSAERARLLQRVETETLSVDLIAELPHGFWGTIGIAVVEFGAEFASGIATMITGIAYVLPWLVVLIPFLYLVRWIWRNPK